MERKISNITSKIKVGFTNRVFKLKKSSRRKLQSSRSTIGSLVEWGEQPAPSAEKNGELPLENLKTRVP